MVEYAAHINHNFKVFEKPIKFFSYIKKYRLDIVKRTKQRKVSKMARERYQNLSEGKKNKKWGPDFQDFTDQKVFFHFLQDKIELYNKKCK